MVFLLLLIVLRFQFQLVFLQPSGVFLVGLRSLGVRFDVAFRSFLQAEENKFSGKRKVDGPTWTSSGAKSVASLTVVGTTSSTRIAGRLFTMVTSGAG